MKNIEQAPVETSTKSVAVSKQRFVGDQTDVHEESIRDWPHHAHHDSPAEHDLHGISQMLVGQQQREDEGSKSERWEDDNQDVSHSKCNPTFLLVDQTVAVVIQRLVQIHM